MDIGPWRVAFDHDIWTEALNGNGFCAILAQP